MDKFNSEDLKKLIHLNNQECVSIYLPTQIALEEITKDQILLKNLLRKTEDQLRILGLKDSEIKDILQPCDKIMSDLDFWNFPGKGLAIFLAKDFSKIVKLKTPFKEYLYVGNRFAIKPLFKFLNYQHRFHILSLGMKNVKFLSCDVYECEEVNIPGMPTNVEEALGLEFATNNLQYHTVGTGGSNQIFHGQGSIKDQKHDKVKRFVNEVDKSLTTYLNNNPYILLIAGTAEYLPVYKEVSKYKLIFDEPLSGNYESINKNEIHQRAVEVLDNYFQKEVDEAISTYSKIKGMNTATDDLTQALVLAYEGRMNFVIIPEDLESWGIFDRMNLTIETHREYQDGDEDLLDLICYETVKNGGNVYLVPQSKMPEGSGIVAAVKRF